MDKITVSAPCKVHLLGEWSVVWGKPALLTSVDLRIKATIMPTPHVIARRERSDRRGNLVELRKIIELIVKKELKIKNIPPYQLEISSQIPMGTHLGSSAAVSVVSIAALLTFLKVKWDLELINKLAYEAEKHLQGNPSGADNSTIVYGGLVWFRKESEDLKIIQNLPFFIPSKLSKNFILINTGKPHETTKQMIAKITANFDKKPKLKSRFLENQESLVRQLLAALKTTDSAMMIRIIRAGERNLESIGVCSPEVKKVIRQIEAAGGAAKICGAGAFSGPTGILLCYHPNPAKIKQIAKTFNLLYFTAKLGVEGIKIEPKSIQS